MNAVILDSEFATESEIITLLSTATQTELGTSRVTSSFDKFGGIIVAKSVNANIKVVKISNIPGWIVASDKIARTFQEQVTQFADQLLHIQFTEYQKDTDYVTVGQDAKYEEFEATKDYKFPFERIDIDLSKIDRSRLTFIMNMQIPAWRKISIIASICLYVKNPPLNYVRDVAVSPDFVKSKYSTSEDFMFVFFPDSASTPVDYHKLLENFGQMTFNQHVRFLKGIHTLFETGLCGSDNAEKAAWKAKLDNVVKARLTGEEDVAMPTVKERFSVVMPTSLPDELTQDMDDSKTVEQHDSPARGRRNIFEGQNSTHQTAEEREAEYQKIIQQARRERANKRAAARRGNTHNISEDIIRTDKSLFVRFNQPLYALPQNRSITRTDSLRYGRQELPYNERIALSEFVENVMNTSEVVPVETFTKEQFIEYYRGTAHDVRRAFSDFFCQRVLNHTNFAAKATGRFSGGNRNILDRYLTIEEQAEYYDFNSHRSDEVNIDFEYGNFGTVLMMTYLFLNYRKDGSYEMLVETLRGSNLFAQIDEDAVIDSIMGFFNDSDVPLTVKLAIDGIEI